MSAMIDAISQCVEGDEVSPHAIVDDLSANVRELPDGDHQ
ncbi:hypothetical protein MycrhN_4885 [Mycolicibacterium rhodesiae NBB3]|jgi:hypothetical protein|uniref:Uncharacterized protein n=1 Tax=Mycolicibacterium rhodesiae (strain NBB3) TaxID=710685 RepID=G8RTJ2_MYCRN|nr:hypothetical protein MycrhN_4885 [Mycolicibacterium rhodesiae NBB3]